MKMKYNMDADVLINMIGLLKEALTFYGDSKNYDKSETTKEPMVLTDGGHMARFVLSNVENLDQQFGDYNKAIDSIIQNSDDEFLSDIILAFNKMENK